MSRFASREVQRAAARDRKRRRIFFPLFLSVSPSFSLHEAGSAHAPVMKLKSHQTRRIITVAYLHAAAAAARIYTGRRLKDSRAAAIIASDTRRLHARTQSITSACARVYPLSLVGAACRRNASERTERHTYALRNSELSF